MVLLLVALIAGGLAAFLATRGGGEAKPEQVTQVVQEARAQVLIAKTNIGIGERLSPNNVQWQDWPEGAVRPEYITSAGTPNAIDQMKGAVARFELFPGEPVQQNKLVRSEQGYLSAVLDKGMRGVSISVSAESASGGFIVPNDHVDVILTQGGGNGQQTSTTLLTNVRVLAINTRLGETGKTGGTQDDSGDAANASPKSQVFPGTAIATVELDPVQAETIINATSLGRLSLALRSIVDFKPTPGETDRLKRNAPIKLIRYGQEANVMAGAASGGVDESGLPIPTTTVTVAPGAALD
jgi:pilus assembly protein CpaB